MKLPNSLHTAIRKRLFPTEPIEKLIPRKCKILDVGCGHGDFDFYLASTSPERQILGLDIDPEKIQYAKGKVLEGGRLSFSLVHDLETTLKEFEPELILMMDIFYILPEHKKIELLTCVFKNTPRPSTLVLKDVDTRPLWKYGITFFQETLSLRVLGITKGHRPHFQSQKKTLTQLESLGYQCKVHIVHKGYPYPHVIYECSF